MMLSTTMKTMSRRSLSYWRAGGGGSPRWFSSVPTDDTTLTESETEEPTPTTTPPLSNMYLTNLKPSEIVSSLDRHIVGQQDAKKAVAIAMRNRWRRRQLPDELRKEVTPRNVLLVGPTGKCTKNWLDENSLNL